jgi:hypothetical protein
MTILNQHYVDLICKYCIHCAKDGCLKDVPWYAVSMSCKFFEDGKPVRRSSKVSSGVFKGGVSGGQFKG